MGSVGFRCKVSLSQHRSCAHRLGGGCLLLYQGKDRQFQQQERLHRAPARVRLSPRRGMTVSGGDGAVPAPCHGPGNSLVLAEGPSLSPMSSPQVFTRYGKCYTFNAGQDGKPRLITMKGGTGNGLEIMLDIQQDEYLPVWGETGKTALQQLSQNPLGHQLLGAPQPLPTSPPHGSMSLRLSPLPSFHFSSLRVLFFPFSSLSLLFAMATPISLDRQPPLVYK